MAAVGESPEERQSCQMAESRNEVTPMPYTLVSGEPLRCKQMGESEVHRTLPLRWL